MPKTHLAARSTARGIVIASLFLALAYALHDLCHISFAAYLIVAGYLAHAFFEALPEKDRGPFIHVSEFR